MSKPGTGASLTDIERVIGTLNDAVDEFESLQAIDPSPALEAIAGNVRFARDTLARNQAAHLEALEKFVRDHPVGAAYDPDIHEVEK
jgi:hypothetical protein